MKATIFIFANKLAVFFGMKTASVPLSEAAAAASFGVWVAPLFLVCPGVSFSKAATVSTRMEIGVYSGKETRAAPLAACVCGVAVPLCCAPMLMLVLLKLLLLLQQSPSVSQRLQI